MFDSLLVPLCMLAIVVGAAVAGYGIWYLRKAAASVDWPQVKGRILTADIELYPSYIRHTGHPEASYEYEVDGVTHTASRVAFRISRGSDNTFIGAFAEGWYDRGQTVPVHVNPADPTDAVLEPGVVRATYLPLAFGIIMLLGGAWGLLGIWLQL